MRYTRRYKSLPYNPYLKKYAKALRKAGMHHEVLLWNQLKRKRFGGLDFDRQKIIGNYIADFFCAEKGVVIEADGSSHKGREAQDARRDAYMASLGLTVIRIPVRDIFQNMGGVLTFLRNHSAFAEGPPQAEASSSKTGPQRATGTFADAGATPPCGHTSKGGAI